MDTTKTKKTDFKKCLVFLGAYVMMVLTLGFLYSMGRLFIIILDTFHDSRASTHTIQSVTFGVFYGFGIFSGAIVHKVGPRNGGLLGGILMLIGFSLSFFANSVLYLTISIGLCVGFGFILTYISGPAAIGMYFDGKSSVIALSVWSSGSGIGGMIFPFIIDTLNEQYGLRGILLITGGIISHGLAFSLLYAPNTTRLETERRVTDLSCRRINAKGSTCISKGINWKNEVKEINETTIPKENTNTGFGRFDGYKEGHSTFKSIKMLFRNKSFITYCIGMTFAATALESVTFFLVDMLMDKGLAIEDATLGLVIFSIFTVLGRFSPGVLKLLPYTSTLAAPIMASCLGILPMIILIFANSYIITMLCTCFVGIAHGATLAGLSVTTVALVGRNHLPNGIGILCTFSCVPILAIGPTIGWLRDKTNSYSIVLITVAVMMCIGLLLFILTQYFRSASRKSRKRDITTFISTKL